MNKQYSDQGLTVLAILADNNPKSVIRSFIQDEKLDHQILIHGDGVAMKTYSARLYPTSYWVDRKGKLVAWEPDYHNYAKFEAMAKKLLKQK